MELGLAGKRILVTGGTRGIGRAIVDGLLTEKAAVAYCARPPRSRSWLPTARWRSAPPSM